MATWFVTRHTGACAWAEEEGFHVDTVVTHLNVAQIRKDDLVLGTLPVNLAADVCARGGRYFHLSMDVPPEMRGVELTPTSMRQYHARLEEYRIERIT